MVIIQWIIWGAFLFVAVGFLFNLRQEAKRNQRIHIVMVAQAVLYFLFSILFFIFPWNKFHLIWIFPTIMMGSQILFIIFRFPVIGTLLRVIFVTFGEAMLVGVGGTIQGVPYGK